MAKSTTYALDGAGTFVSIPATIFARYLQIQEDGSGAASGLQIKWPTDNFTAVFKYPSAQQPIKPNENPETLGLGQGVLLGWPAQTGLNTRAADVYCKIASMGAATVVRVDERE
ncbi:MAG: hypothetical protein ACLQLH_03535 [Terracidiphilus sp.]